MKTNSLHIRTILGRKAFMCALLLPCFAVTVNAKDKKTKATSVGTNTGKAEDGGENKKKTYAINEVVVTGQYAPNNPEKAIQKIKIIDHKKIEAMSAQNLRDLLTNELNIRISQDNILGSSMNIQGIGGEGVKILIDGVPVIGRQGGNIDLSQINLQNVERVEIVEGPMSVSYGTDAIAGTINIITKKNQQHFLEAGATTYYESIGTYNVNGHVGLHKNKHTLLINGGRNFFGGWKDGQPISFFDFKAQLADSSRNIQWLPKEQYNASLQYIYKLGNTTFNYKGDYFNEFILNRGLPGDRSEMALDDHYITRRLDNALFINSSLAMDKRISFQVAYNLYNRVKNTYATDLSTLAEQLVPTEDIQDTSTYSQVSSRATYSTSKPNAKINYEVGYDINLESGSGQRIKNGDAQINDYAAFASAEYKPLEQLTIRPGVRYAYNTIFPAPVVPSVNIRYKLNDFNIRASFAQGFRAPSLKELYFNFHDGTHEIDGNPDLKAEYSNSYNLSVSHNRTISGANCKFDVSGFFNDFSNRIDLALVGKGNQWTYFNIGKYKTLGVQASAEVSYRQLKVVAGGSYTGRYNSLAESEDVASFSYSPEVRCNVSYVFAQSGITANLFYKYNGALPGFGFDENNKLMRIWTSDYSMFDLSISKAFFEKRVGVTVGCKNIFDVKNITRTGVAADNSAPHSSGSSSPVGTGRNYFIKLNFNFHSN